MTGKDGYISAGWLGFTLLLGACSPLGPDFVHPAAPQVSQYTGHPGMTPNGEDIPADWWVLFHSRKLDDLVQSGLRNSPTVDAARAALGNALEYAEAQKDNLMLPGVNASLAQSRERFAPAAYGFPGSPEIFNLTNASVSVSYTLDVFGANRRQVESLEAQAEMQRYQWRATEVTLASNIVTTAIHEASLNAQVRETRAMVAIEQQTLSLFESRFKAGALSLSDVQAQRSTLAQLQATLPDLDRQLSQTRHQLAAYLGRFPANAELPSFELDEISMPQHLPVSLPSQLVHQRPDILASEANLHQATANLGYTIASVYPNLTLSGSMGSMALQPGNLFTPNSSVWNIGGNLLQPIFHGGALEAGERAARDALDQAAAQYRQTVVNAFQNVADVLRALETDQQALMARTEAADAAMESLRLAKVQFANGSISVLALMQAEERADQARLSLAQTRATRLADSAALFLAMGGGWWNEPVASIP